MWHCIRAGGKVNEWTQQSADAGVMAIEGNAGASAGYAGDIVPARTRVSNRVQFKIAGTPGARYYVTLNSTAGVNGERLEGFAGDGRNGRLHPAAEQPRSPAS